MKNHPIRLAVTICVGVLAACASTGNRAIKGIDQEGAARILHRGVSTKADVTLALGSAKVNKFDSGYEVWSYRYTEVTPNMRSFVPVVGKLIEGSHEHTHELVILFNPTGVVTKFRVYDGLNEASP